MAKNLSGLEISVLLHRKDSLVQALSFPPNAIRASYVRQMLTCGKKECRCRRGRKHGPFHYLVQCAGVGKVNKFLLKSEGQRRAARRAIAAYAALRKRLELLSEINTELLRRGQDPGRAGI